MKKRTKKLKSLEKAILQYFINEPNTLLVAKMLHKKLGKRKYTKDDVVVAAQKLWERGKLDKDGNKFSLNKDNARPDKYKNSQAHGSRGERKNKRQRFVATGKVDMIRTGAAYIVLNQEGVRDVFVSQQDLKGAIDGDKVKIQAYSRRGRIEGEVIEIVERSQEEFSGIIHISKTYAFVIADNQRKIKEDIFVPIGKINGAKSGQKVLVKITEWNTTTKKSPEGTVLAVLGKPGENDVEMKAILIENGFSLRFSKLALQQADELSTFIDEEEIARRRDMRQVPTFTIDPTDAKDFDDALSIQKLDSGNWEIGVHIADVSHYVPIGSDLDQDAFDRATSVYLVDRVAPMFPERLSNVICSLRPNEDKCTYSVVFEMDEEGKVHNEWFGRTVTHSDRRFTYGEAQQVLETGEGDFAQEIQLMDKIAKILRKQRFAKGSINFGSDEVRFKLDETGKPIEVYTKVIQDSNRLIEDFMLLANRSVAKRVNMTKIKGRDIPFVNRIHDEPDEQKLVDFDKLASAFGYRLDFTSAGTVTSSLNELLTAIQGKPEENLLSNLALRSMAKAVYSTDNVGHYGLGFGHYAHFTSPIRHYPNVMVHRILTKLLNKEHINLDGKEALEQRCRHCSDMERKAITAERASTKYKQVEFLSDKIGEEFDGIISGVTK
ncbi:MAG: ribonuclease R, partial [Chitinophagales bacterium]